MVSVLLKLLATIIVVESVTELVIKSNIFKPIRGVLSRGKFLSDLFSCGYCMSVWVSAMSVLVVGMEIDMTGWWIINYIITVLIVHRGANILHNVIDKYTDKLYDMRYVNGDMED